MVSVTEIKHRLIECIAIVMRCDPENLRSMPDDEFLMNFGVNSLNYIQLLASVEQEFGIKFSTSELLPGEVETLGKLSQFIAKKIG